MLSRVDLPVPDSPTNATRSPRAILSAAFRNIQRSPNRLPRAESATTGKLEFKSQNSVWFEPAVCTGRTIGPQIVNTPLHVTIEYA